MRGQRELSGRQRFIRARRATTYVYRKVIFQDLLQRLLHPSVWDAYANKNFRMERSSDRRMNVEFAHAAFRAGHSMVRAKYELSDGILDASLTEVIQRRGATPLDDTLPHSRNWLIGWSRFFQFPGRREPQVAARLSPSAQAQLLNHENFKDGPTQEGGLIYADLLRGAFSGVRSVDSLIEAVTRAGLPGSNSLRRDSWEPPLASWLESKRVDAQLTTHDVSCLLRDPPLLLFVLFEGQFASARHSFGTLGSAIVAETFFAERDRTKCQIEQHEGTRQLVTAVFGDLDEPDAGPSEAGPADMPSMITALARRLGYENLTYPFI